MLKTTIYFGSNLTWPDGTDGIADFVNHAQWAGFMDQVVSKHYKGYTWSVRNGAWKGTCEDVFVLEIVHEKAAEEATAIADIVMEYKTLYNQESVMVTVQELNVQFI